MKAYQSFLKLAALFIAILFALISPAQAQHKWKSQILYGPNTVVYKEFQKFAERVKVGTKGALIIETFPVGTIVPQAEALDAIQAGLLDAASGTMAYQGERSQLPPFGIWRVATIIHCIC